MDKKSKSFFYLMLLITITSIYLIAVVADYFLHLSIYSNVRESQKIITKKKQTEDRPLFKKAKEDGYSPIMLPYLFSDNAEIYESITKKKEIVPVSAQPNRDVYYCNEGYGLIKFKTDKLGFRNNNDVWENYYKNENNIIFIGDSFTAGACVEAKYNIPSYFLKDYNPINLAWDGNNPSNYASLGKIFIPVIKPKYVVTIFYGNDNTYNSPDGFAFWKNLENINIHKNYFRQTGKNIEISDEIIKTINELENFYVPPTPGVRNNIVQRGIRYLALPTITRTIKIYYLKLFFQIPFTTQLAIDEVSHQCAKFNCIPIFSFIPNSDYWEPNPLKNHYKLSIKEYVESKNFKFIDFTNSLNKIDDNKAYAPKGTHLSPIGYKVVANDIKQALKELN